MPKVPSRRSVRTRFSQSSQEFDSSSSSVQKRATYKRHNKPPYSYVGLISMAIMTSGGQATLAEINARLKSWFTFFNDSYTGWKDSIRHMLSNNPCFQKVLRFPSKPNAKGNMWTVDVNGVATSFLIVQSTGVARSGDFPRFLHQHLGYPSIWELAKMSPEKRVTATGPKEEVHSPQSLPPQEQTTFVTSVTDEQTTIAPQQQTTIVPAQHWQQTATVKDQQTTIVPDQQTTIVPAQHWQQTTTVKDQQTTIVPDQQTIIVPAQHWQQITTVKDQQTIQVPDQQTIIVPAQHWQQTTTVKDQQTIIVPDQQTIIVPAQHWQQITTVKDQQTIIVPDQQTIIVPDQHWQQITTVKDQQTIIVPDQQTIIVPAQQTMQVPAQHWQQTTLVQHQQTTIAVEEVTDIFADQNENSTLVACLNLNVLGDEETEVQFEQHQEEGQRGTYQQAMDGSQFIHAQVDEVLAAMPTHSSKNPLDLLSYVALFTSGAPLLSY